MITKAKMEPAAALVAEVAIGGGPKPLEVATGVLKGISVDGACVTGELVVNADAGSMLALPAKNHV